MQCACNLLSSVARPTLQYFSALSHKRHDFFKAAYYKMCVLIFSTTFVSNISHYRKKWVRCDQKRILVFMQSTRYSYQILMKLEFSRQISKNSQISHSMNIHPVGAELFHEDRRTDMTKLTDAFHNFANAPKSPLPKPWAIQALIHTIRQQPIANLRTKRLLQQNPKKGNGRWCHLVPAPENKRPSLVILCLVCT